MRRLIALLMAVALLVPFAGLAQGAGTPPAQATGPHAFGHFLIGDGTTAIGWVTIDVRPSTSSRPDPGLFLFEALPGVPDVPATTRAAIIWTDFYHESVCCGFPDSLSMGGHEVLYFPGPWNHYREFWAGFFDVGAGPGTDFMRWANTADMPAFDEWVVMQGNLTVDLGS